MRSDFEELCEHFTKRAVSSKNSMNNLTLPWYVPLKIGDPLFLSLLVCKFAVIIGSQGSKQGGIRKSGFLVVCLCVVQSVHHGGYVSLSVCSVFSFGILFIFWNTPIDSMQKAHLTTFKTFLYSSQQEKHYQEKYIWDILFKMEVSWF